MLRLFGIAGLCIIVATGTALATNLVAFRLLTILVGLLVTGLYFWLRRSLPKRRGSSPLPGLREAAEVTWDDRGVPHIQARNVLDLYTAQGYVTAGDRLWTMDVQRRIASGRLAAILGPKVLELDKHFRTIGLRRMAEASYQSMSPEVQSVLQAYAAGVNARMAEGRLPLEFSLLRYRPDPWDAIDSLAVAKFISYTSTGSWAPSLLRAKLVQTVGAEKAAELFPTPPDIDLLHMLEEIDLPNVEHLLQLADTVAAEFVGSSGWVIGGSRTRSGGPLLANAPHLNVSNPADWYQTHLVGPDGLDVIGAAIPGIPGIIIGHNREIAWGISEWSAPVIDLFAERLNPATPDEFEFQGAWQKAEVIQESITVRGMAQPVHHDVLITRHGPLIASDGRAGIALQWTALGQSSEIETFLAINRARTWGAFQQVLQGHQAPALAFLFAGRDGTIAAQACGKVPVRTRGQGQIPVPGWTGEFDWQTYLPFAELPGSKDPTDGLLVVRDAELAPYRAQRAAERLRGAADLTVEKLKDLQMDRVNLQARSLLQVLLNAVQEGQRQAAHLGFLNQREKKALLMLSGWDCEEVPNKPEAALWHQWYNFLLEEIFRPQMGLELFDQFMAHGMPVHVTDHLIRKVAEGKPSQWLALEGEYGLGPLALRSFKRAVALLAAKQGPRMEYWRWDKEHRIRFRHFLGHLMPMFRPVLDLGPFKVGGSGTTMNTQAYSFLRPFDVQVAAQWRQIVDLGQWEDSVDICAPGQSGHPLSPHHADQLSAWLKGEYHPQLYRHASFQDYPKLVLHPPT